MGFFFLGAKVDSASWSSQQSTYSESLASFSRSISGTIPNGHDNRHPAQQCKSDAFEYVFDLSSLLSFFEILDLREAGAKILVSEIFYLEERRLYSRYITINFISKLA
jgi:hypothetical protein